MGAKRLNYEDYDGKKFGRLTIVCRVDNHNKGGSLVVRCLCDCGKAIEVPLSSVKAGNTKSCGCQKLDSSRTIGHSKLVDLTGCVFGRLTVLYRDDTTKSSKTMWVCQCECGNYTTAESYSLKKGYKKSCGCLSRETTSRVKLIDLTGQRFGKWVVVGRSGSSGSNATWVCKCDCGNAKIIAGNSLRNGDSMSCGCEQSQGEIKMSSALHDAGIIFERQRKFKGCFYRYLLKFDFYIPSLRTVIEIQGIQHYEPVKHFGGDSNFRIAQRRDNIKREYCKLNSINLIEIRYDEFHLMDDIVAGLKNKYDMKDVI